MSAHSFNFMPSAQPPQPPEGEERRRGFRQLQGSLPAGTSQTAIAAESSTSTTMALVKPGFQSPMWTSLLAFGLSPHVGQQGLQAGAKSAPGVGDDPVLLAVLPPKLLELTQAMQHALSAIRVVPDPSESGGGLTHRDKTGLLQPHPVSMRIQDTPDGFCGVCGVDIMEGKGKDTCAYQQVCDPAFVSSIQAAALYDDSTAAEIPPVGPSSFPASNPSSHPQATPPPSPTPLRRIARAAQAAGNEDLPLPASPPAAEARFIVLASLDVVTSAEESPLTFSILKDAISFALGDDVDDPYHQVFGEDAIQVEVVSAGVDEMFAHMYPKEFGEEGGHVYKERRRLRRLVPEGGAAEKVKEAEDEDEEVTLQLRKYKVILTSTSKPKVRRALRALGVQDPAREASRHLQMEEGEDEDIILTAEMASDVVTYLRSHGTGSENSVEGASMAFERTLYVPAYDATAFTSGDFLAPHLGDFGMRLSDPTMPAMPLSHVGYKTAYTLSLENFPSNARVQVTALRSSRGDGEGDTSLPWRFPLATVNTNGDGSASVAVKFWSAMAFPPGDYEIQARVAETGAFGLSPLYTLSREGHRRKLYGTSIWL